ncbi:MAG: FtsQ-type POTRA domain-containing protein [Hyphomicrobiales bacterium]|nr:FtsQ-type POTRA domain-containing protein [Hyphomicrobiales bacterium]
MYGGRFSPRDDAKGGWLHWWLARGDAAARLGLAASILYLAAAGGYAAMLSGSMEQATAFTVGAANAAARSAGFEVSKVVIRGRVNASEQALLAALDADVRDSTLFFDADAARRRIAAIGWVKTVEIQKLWPATLVVAVVERQPVAVWVDGAGAQHAVDERGAVLGPVKAAEMSGLIRVRGEGAAAASKGLADALAPHPRIRAAVVAAERVGRRRWDLLLKSDLRVKLPEDAPPALAALSDLLADDAAPLAQASAVDLRVAGQAALTRKTASDGLRPSAIAGAATVTAAVADAR